MAITIHNSPPQLSPVYNTMMFVVSSTLAATQYFKMIAKVYHGGTLLKTLKYDKWPHGNYIQADVHRMLETRYGAVINNLAVPTYGFALVDGCLANYKVEFIEELNNVPISSGMVTATGYAFNASLKYLDRLQFLGSSYNMTTGYERNFLTNAPRIQRIRENEAAELGFISTSKNCNSAKITTYNGLGNIISVLSISHNYYSAQYSDKGMALSFMCGPYNLNAYAAANSLGNIITANVAKYEVQLLNGVGQEVSEVFTFEIDRKTYRHEMFRIHFLNRLGRFDSFTFSGRHKQTAKIQRSEYQKFTGYTDLNSMTWIQNSYDRGKVVFDTVETEQYALSSNWISEEESKWLQELAASPEVYWQIDPADNMKTVAVNISEDNYEVKKYANKKIFALNLTMELAQPNYTQRA